MSIKVLSYGGGTNSKALAVEYVRRGEKIDLIIFSDTGGERPETYKDIEETSKWLVERGYPEITIVRLVTKDGIELTLEQDCLNRKALPAITYGLKTCSQRFKIQVVDKFLKHWKPAIEAWARGEKVIKLVGIDAGEQRRAKYREEEKFITEYPLIEWDWDREDCVKVIAQAGLSQPGKSSCFFCPSMKKHEIFQLKKEHPDLLERALKIEDNAELTVIAGLGRNYAWRNLIEADEAQTKLFSESYCDISCGCYDG